MGRWAGIQDLVIVIYRIEAEVLSVFLAPKRRFVFLK